MMSYLIQLSIIIVVSIRLFLTLEFDELNICDTQTQITVEHAFRFQNKFVAFVKLNISDTVYVIKADEFYPLVANNQFELRSKSVKLWDDWIIDTYDYRFDDLENFYDVFVREDPLVHYVVYLKDTRYYKVQYNDPFTRVLFYYSNELLKCDDLFQIKIHEIIDNILGDRYHTYHTSMRFPEETDFPRTAFVYRKNTDKVLFIQIRNSTPESGGRPELGKILEPLDSDLGSEQVVSAFYITNYTLVDGNRKQFYMMEILSSGDYKVKNITFMIVHRNQVTVTGLDSTVFNGTIRQLFNCPLMSTTTSTIYDNFASSDPIVVPLDTTSLTPDLSAAAVESTHEKNNTWYYIIAAIILLLIVAAIIVLIFVLFRRNKKSESVENGSKENIELKPIPKKERNDKEEVKPNTDVDSSENQNTENQAQDSEPADNTASGVTPQSQTPIDDTKAPVKKKHIKNDLNDERPLYSIDGFKRFFFRTKK